MERLTREQGRRILHAAGLRATAPRLAVLRLLHESSRPLSHSEVVEHIGTEDWDPATLYRNLIKLDEAGLARVASQAGGITRFEARRAGEPARLHPHFSCQECGQITCLHDTQITVRKDGAWREAILEADLQVVGRCPTCRSAPKPGRRRRGARSR